LTYGFGVRYWGQSRHWLYPQVLRSISVKREINSHYAKIIIENYSQQFLAEITHLRLFQLPFKPNSRQWHPSPLILRYSGKALPFEASSLTPCLS
jgi:hypothetical protein